MGEDKIRHESHILEEKSIDAFKAILPESWIVEQSTKDYGIDLTVQIVENRKVTGKKFCVQMKAIDSLEEIPEKPTYSMDLSSLKLYEKYTDPVVIVYAITDKTRSFWEFYHIFAQKYINEILSKNDPEWRLNESGAKNPTRTIRFDKNCLLDNEKPLAEIADKGRFYVSKLLLEKEGQLPYLDGIPSSKNEELKDLLDKALKTELAEKHRETIEILEKALILHNIETTEKMALLINLGNAYYDLSDIGNALKNYEAVLENAKKVDEKSALECRALGLWGIGLIYNNMGEMDEALKYNQEALEIHRKIGNRLGEASVLGNIGLIYSDLGDSEKALKYLQDALKIDREIGYRQGEASDLGNIGLIYSSQGDSEKALKYHLDALKIHKEVGYRQGEASQLGNIGLIYSDLGDFRESLKISSGCLED